MDYLDSTSDEFGTPQDLFEDLHAEFFFTLDVAASKENTKLPRFFTKEDDALKQDWLAAASLRHVTDPQGAAWCNPPYSRGNVEAFVKKAYEESLRGLTTVLLIPARTEQDWFHDIVLPNAEVRFIRKRIKFEGGATSARFPSMLVVFRPPTKKWSSP